MSEEANKKTVSRGKYEQLCALACKHPERTRPNETIQDAYWRSICREVYRYLEVPFYFQTIEGVSRGEIYRDNLRRLVDSRHESFKPRAIARKYISKAIDHLGRRSKKTGI